MINRYANIPLHDELLDALHHQGLVGEDVDHTIAAVISYLQHTYAGDMLYIPRPARVIPANNILSARRAGMSVRSICKRWHISSKTLYRLIDNNDRAPSAIVRKTSGD